jgi:hypothetical protein
MEIQFSACQTVEIPVASQAVPIKHYLRQPRRVVNALAASSQIEHLGDDLYRLKMRPLTFMMFKLQPVVDMQVWAESDGTIQLRSIASKIRGFEYVNQRFALNLSGILQPIVQAKTTLLKGQANLEVRIELPPALRLTPRSLLEATGNSLLKSVLLTIKQRLMHHLLSDYYAWASDREQGDVAEKILLPTNNPIA